MLVEIFVTSDRVPYLQEMSNLNVKILDEIEGSHGHKQMKIQMTVNDTLDVLEVFHAGIRYGLDIMSKVGIK